MGFGTIAVGALVLLVVGCGGNGGGNGDSGPCPAEGLEVPDVAGDWLISGPTLGASDCPDEVDDILQDAVDNADECVFTVSQDGANVTAVDCNDIMFRGCVDEEGNVTLGVTQRDSELGCNVRVDAQLGANLTASPTAGSLALRIRVSGVCIIQTDCDAVIDATVTEVVEGAVQSARGVGLPSATLRGLLDHQR
jgi:hypothetical protein